MFRTYSEASSLLPSNGASSSGSSITGMSTVSTDRRSQSNVSVTDKVFEIEQSRFNYQEPLEDPRTKTHSIVRGLRRRLREIEKKDGAEPRLLSLGISDEFINLENALYQGYMTGEISNQQLILDCVSNVSALEFFLEDIFLRQQEKMESDPDMSEELLKREYKRWILRINRGVKDNSRLKIEMIYDPETLAPTLERKEIQEAKEGKRFELKEAEEQRQQRHRSASPKKAEERKKKKDKATAGSSKKTPAAKAERSKSTGKKKNTWKP